MLCDVQVVKDSTGSHNSIWHFHYAKTLKRFCFKLFEQSFFRCIFRKNPVIKFVSEVMGGERDVQFGLGSANHKHLLWRKVRHKLVDIVCCSLSGEKFTGGDIQECHTDSTFAEVDSGEKIILLMVQHIITDSHAGSDKFRDASFYEFFSHLGVFQLFADSHASACTDKFRQICVQSMVRKACEFYSGSIAVGTFGKSDAKDFRCSNSIIGKSFIEIAHSEKKHCIGMLLFHLEILLHQWSFNNLFSHSASK